LALALAPSARTELAPGAPPVSPSAAIAQPLELELEWIQGVGAATARRLELAGIRDAHKLVALDDTAFRAATGLGATGAQKLRARLNVLVATAGSVRLPAALPSEITLSQVFGASAPPGVDAAEWNTLRTRALGLQLVFDKRRWGEIALRRLFV
jgi:hypothetical protein